jgi:hypothetical protein
MIVAGCVKNSQSFRADRPSWFSFLRLETEVALTFIQTAEVHVNRENVERALGKARKALAAIRHGLEKPSYHGLSEDEIAFLEKRCVEIERALSAF